MNSIAMVGRPRLLHAIPGVLRRWVDEIRSVARWRTAHAVSVDEVQRTSVRPLREPRYYPPRRDRVFEDSVMKREIYRL